LNIFDPVDPFVEDSLVWQFSMDFDIVFPAELDVSVDSHPLVIFEFDHVLVDGLVGTHQFVFDSLKIL
jgi:hypothetical protein